MVGLVARDLQRRAAGAAGGSRCGAAVGDGDEGHHLAVRRERRALLPCRRRPSGARSARLGARPRDERPSASASPPSGSSRSSRASPMSRSRRLDDLSRRQRRSSRRRAGGVRGGRRVQSGSRSSTPTMVSAIVSPQRTRDAGEHLVEHAAERPDVGALVDRLAARLLRAHVGRRAEHVPARVDAAAASSAIATHRAPVPASALAEAEVEHLHDAVGRDLDVGGLQVAVDDALLVRALRAPRRSGARSARASAQRRVGHAPSALLEGRRLRPAPGRARASRRRPRCRRWRRYADGSAPRAAAPRARIAPADPGRARTEAGRTLSATSRPSFGSRAR